MIRLQAPGLALATAALCVSWSSAPTAQSKQPVTVEDTVELRSLEADLRLGASTLALSPDGRQIAFVLCEPNLQTDLNDTVLYVRELPTANAAPVTPERHNGKAVLRSQGLVQILWLPDSHTLLVLHRTADKRVLERIDVSSGRRTSAYSGALDIETFAASADGRRIILSGRLPTAPSPRGTARRGLVITEEDSALSIADRAIPDKASLFQRVAIVVVDADGGAAVVYRSAAESSDFVRSIAPLSLSPDGRWLSFVTRTDDIQYPQAWKADPWYRRLVAAGLEHPPKILLLELPTRLSARDETAHLPVRTRIAFDSAVLHSATYWSDDSSAYLVQAPAPVGDGRVVARESGRGDRARARLYLVEVATNSVTPVLDSAPEAILAFDAAAGRIVAQLADGEIVVLRRNATRSAMPARRVAGAWIEQQRFRFDVPGRTTVALAAANDQVVVASVETTTLPPDLYVLDRDTARSTVLTEINPQLRGQLLGGAESIEWTGSHALRYSGYLIYPVGYIAGARYPGVIMAKGWDDSFIHGGQVYRSNFPPQALAGAGLVVLLLRDRASVPDAKGLPQLPGAMAEAAIAVDQFVTAREQLQQRGLADPARVGVMGFSRSSWKVDYLLTRPGSSWSAAVSVDSGLYNYGVYFLAGKRSRVEARSQYGGPPYGRSLAAWREHAPAFNADRMRTPLLMQYHSSAASPAELFIALREQGKPVELIYFPDGAHILELPSQRAASMQQVVDWFRFWLQGYERANVEHDPGRYDRWRALKRQQAWNEDRIATGRNPSQEFIDREAR